jgi:hypothetical protein
MQRNKGKRYGTIESRVAKGAAWLDKVRPSWFTDIDIDELRLSSGCHCVLGQIVHKEFAIAGKATQANGYSNVVVREPSYNNTFGFATREDIVSAKAAVSKIDSLAKLVMPGITAKRRGFELTKFQGVDGDTTDEWNALTEEWRSQIIARREAAKALV